MIEVTYCKNRHKTPGPVTINSLGPSALPDYRIPVLKLRDDSTVAVVNSIVHLR